MPQEVVTTTKEEIPLFEDYLNSAFPCDDLFFNDKWNVHVESPLLRGYTHSHGSPSSPESSHSVSSKDDSTNEVDSDISLTAQHTHNDKHSNLGNPIQSLEDNKELSSCLDERSPRKGTVTNTEAAIRSLPCSMAAPSYQLNLHGIPSKSRVETQIRLGLQLVQVFSNGNESQERDIGDRFQWLKLPSWAMAKEKLKIQNRRDAPATIDPNRIMFLDARVVKSTEPLEDVTICSGCVTRERKRAQRKKDPPKRSPTQSLLDAPKMKSEPAELLPLPDEEKKILVFNCPELLEVSNGEVIIPTRVTCYCRHHKEKDGFRIIITLRDASNNILASTSSELVLITDDHKTTGKVQRVKDQITCSVKGLPYTVSHSSSISASITDSIPILASSIKTSASPVDGKSALSRSASRRSSMSSTATSRKRKAEQTVSGANSNNTSKVQRIPGSLSMTNMARLREAHSSTSKSSATSRAPSPTASCRQFKRSPSQDSLLLFMNEAPCNQPGSFKSPVPSTSLANSTSSPENCFFDTSMEEVMQDRNSSLSPRTRTWDYIIDTASQIPVNGPQSSLIMPPTTHLRTSAEVPSISRMVPSEGPLRGGVEVTMLGSGFYPGMTAMFGETCAVPTHCWSPTTLVCVLPPATNAGPVPVTFKEHPYSMGAKMFTYIDETDRALYELALQVIGLKTTGRLETARDVAMRICSSRSPSETVDVNMGSMPIHQLKATLGLPSDEVNTEELVRRCLLHLDDIDTGRSTRISHRSRSGHTLLHLACIQGYSMLVEDLLERGANANIRDRASFTALHSAALHGKRFIAEKLLLSGHANPSLCTSDGRTAYDLAVARDDAALLDVLDPWAASTFQPRLGLSGRTTRSNSMVSCTADSEDHSVSPGSCCSAPDVDLNMVIERLRNSRRLSLGSRSDLARTRSASSSISPETRSHGLGHMHEELRNKRATDLTTSKVHGNQEQAMSATSDLDKAQEADTSTADAHTIAANLIQLQHTWMAFLSETSPIWLQKTLANANASLPDVLKNTPTLSHHMPFPTSPISAFQAMLPHIPHFGAIARSPGEQNMLGGPSKVTVPNDASWLQSIVSSLGAPPSYAEATSITESDTSSKDVDVSTQDVGPSNLVPVVEPVPVSSACHSDRFGSSTISPLRSQGRVAEMTPEQQRAQVRRLQKPADRMMFFFWLPCLVFFIFVSIGKAFLGKLIGFLV